MQILELTARSLPIAFVLFPVAYLTISRALQKRKLRKLRRINRAIIAQRLFF